MREGCVALDIKNSVLCASKNFILIKLKLFFIASSAQFPTTVSPSLPWFIDLPQHDATSTFLSFYPVFNIYLLRRRRTKCLREISRERHTLRKRGSRVKEELAKHRDAQNAQSKEDRRDPSSSLSLRSRLSRATLCLLEQRRCRGFYLRIFLVYFK